MAKVTFSIQSTATQQTVFVLPVEKPDAGEFVKLKKKDSKRSGAIELGAGKHQYLMRLEAGSPGGKWALTVQREGRQPVEREGKLDSEGNGGEIGQVTVF
jgi:hypothetical protein